MSRKYWLGGASWRGFGYVTDYDGDWNFDSSGDATYGNWILENGTVTTKPGAGDVVVFDYHATLVGSTYNQDPALHTIGKHFSCFDNIHPANTGGLDFEAIIVTREFTGLIGQTKVGTIEPLCCSIADNGYVLVQGNETTHIRCAASDDTTSINIPLVIFDSVSGALNLSSNLNTRPNGTQYKNYFDKIEVLNAGTLELKLNNYDDYAGGEAPPATSLGEGVVFDYMYVSNDFSGTAVIGAKCIDHSDSDDPGDFEIYGGDIYCDSSMGTTQIAGASTMVKQGRSTVDLTNKINLDNILLLDGEFIWNCYGDLIAGKQYGGKLKATGSGDKIFTTAAGSDFEQHGGEVDFSAQYGKVELGTGRKILRRGGTFEPPRNAKLTFENILTE